MSPARAFLLLGFVGVFTALLFTSLSSHVQQAFAQTDHVVISQIQMATTGIANGEFVELYNPTDYPVSLTGWRLSKRSTGISSTLTSLISSMSGTISPHGYFLLAHSQYTNATADLTYSNSSGIAVNNSVILYSDNGKTIVDKVGFGTAEDVETTGAPSIPTDQSLLRKATSSSTAESLSTGGSEQCAGNGLDTDNNNTDFVLLTTPIPKNSNSSICPPFPSITPTTEPSATPTNTPEPTLTSTPTETLTPTVTDTPAETPEPSPTETPTPTVTPSPSPTNTQIPTTTPTQTLTPILTPTITSTPSPTPTPTNTPTPEEHNGEHHEWRDIKIPLSRHKVLLCQMEYKTVRYGRRTIKIPQIVCHIVTEENKSHDKKNHFAN